MQVGEKSPTSMAKKSKYDYPVEAGTRCCWLSPNQIMCKRKATSRRLVFSDRENELDQSKIHWFDVPVCKTHS
jgi:hypothetical protein